MSNVAPAGEIPETVRWAFYIGGAALLAAVSWTVFTTREYSQQQLRDFAGAGDTSVVPDEAAAARRSARQFANGGAIWLGTAIVVGLFVRLARQDPRPEMLSIMGDLAIAKELYALAALIGLFGAVQLLAAMMRSRAQDQGGFMEVVNDLFAMPATMRQLAVVQFFSWFAMFAMWIYGTPAVAEFHFAAPDPATRGYQDAADR